MRRLWRRSKLLRKLSLEVGTISRLKAGELTLSQALREQAAVLEADRGGIWSATPRCAWR